MLLACLVAVSCLIIVPSAEGANDPATTNQSGFIQVDYVSDHTSNTKTYANVFQEYYRQTVVTETPTEAGSVDIRGQFKAASTVNQIRVFTEHTQNYIANLTISLSVDNENWVNIQATPDASKQVNTSETKQFWFYDFYVTDITEYEYVKITNKTTDAFGIIYVALYSNNLVLPTVVKTGASGSSDTDIPEYKTYEFWSGNTVYANNMFGERSIGSPWNSKSVQNGDVYSWSVIARFDTPTVVTGALLVARQNSTDAVAARINGLVLQGSNYAGNNLAEAEWTTISNNTISGVTKASPTAYLTTQNTQAYTYIRIYKENNAEFSMSIQGLVLNGYETTPVVSYTQYSTPDTTNNVQNIRILGTVDYRCYAEIGYNVTVSWVDGDNTVTKELGDVKCEYLYFSINAKESGTLEKKTARDLGGNYIFALTLQNVPTNKGDVTITVKPYIKHTAGSAPVYGAVGTAKYNNGTPITGPDFSEPETFLYLVEDGQTSFEIVYSENATVEELAAVNQLMQLFEEYTGVQLVSKSDHQWESETPADDEKLILIGKTDHTASIKAYQNLTYHDYKVKVSQNALVIAAHSADGYTDALDWLEKNVFPNITEESETNLTMSSKQTVHYTHGNYKYTSWKISGTELEEYKIVYADDAILTDLTGLVREIGACYGHVLEVVKDTESQETEHEILFGNTNRAASAQRSEEHTSELQSL